MTVCDVLAVPIKIHRNTRTGDPSTVLSNVKNIIYTTCSVRYYYFFDFDLWLMFRVTPVYREYHLHTRHSTEAKSILNVNVRAVCIDWRLVTISCHPTNKYCERKKRFRKHSWKYGDSVCQKTRSRSINWDGSGMWWGQRKRKQ